MVRIYHMKMEAKGSGMTVNIWKCFSPEPLPLMEGVCTRYKDEMINWLSIITTASVCMKGKLRILFASWVSYQYKAELILRHVHATMITRSSFFFQ